MIMSPEQEPDEYKKLLRSLQIQLVQLQRRVIENDEQLLVILEGRDAAGKDGVIKRITRHLSPREMRVMALGKPSSRDNSSWYFQRFVAHLPAQQEIVLMNRSWYNRAGVERVMGFCSEAEYEHFMASVSDFEAMLRESGIQIIKYYLDISREEQEKRLQARQTNPLKQWKTSPIDSVALEHWDDYSSARNDMLTRTHNTESPWYIVRANHKKAARIHLIQHLLQMTNMVNNHISFNGYITDEIIHPFTPALLKNEQLQS